MARLLGIALLTVAALVGFPTSAKAALLNVPPPPLVRGVAPLKAASSTILGAAQFQSVDGATPQETIVANANVIVITTLNAVNGPGPSGNDALQTIEALSFPEYSLFGSSPFWPLTCGFSEGKGEVMKKISTSERATKLAPYCETLPPVGTYINCIPDPANDGFPYKIITCGIMYGIPNVSWASWASQRVTVTYDTCLREGDSYYNAQVAVGASQILGVYRKSHLIYEKCFDTPAVPEVVTYTSIFSNLTIGMFSGLDILFPSPKNDLLSMGVKLFTYAASDPFLFQTVVTGFFSGVYNVSVAASNAQGQSAVIAGGTVSGDACSDTVGSTPCTTLGIVPV